MIRLEIGNTHSVLSPFLKGWILPVGLLLLLLFHLLGFIPMQSALRGFCFDLYQIMFPRERVSGPAVIVDIDEESLKRFGQWPWPRSRLAELVERVGEAQPAAIGIDIIMPEPDRISPCSVGRLIPGIRPALLEELCSLPSNDERLAQVLRQYPTVLGVAGINDTRATALLTTPVQVIGGDPLPFVRRYRSALSSIDPLQNAVAGHAILSADMDRGVVRRVPMVAAVGEHLFPSLSLEMLRLAIGSPAFSVTSDGRAIQAVGAGELNIPTQADGSMWVHYSRHDPSRFVSAARILDGDFDASLFERKLVLIGFTGLGLVDFPSTALGERVPGVEIHAQVLETVFDGTTLVRPGWAPVAEGAMMLLLGFIVIYLLPRLRVWFQLPVVVVLVCLLAGTGLVLYTRYQLLIDVASPYLLFAVLYVALLADAMMTGEGKIEVLEEDLREQREAALRIQGEMEAAKRFQMSMVPDPDEVFAMEPRIDLAAMMEPAKMVGGDLYDCFMLDEHRVFLIIGDVCGKGVHAALFMVISKTLCKSVALRNHQDIDLGELVTQANREIARDNPEMLFVTAFIAILDLRNGELVYVNAGHEPPALTAPGCRVGSLIHSSGPPIAIMDDYQYDTFRHRLSSDEFLCIFTDGIT
ncbi:MAG: CHASE2 domain-containing protein, partial [Oceanospirillales bacterium]|nr:CHASE2 domain-containing protein [Oceanospirillales bacterium]